MKTKQKAGFFVFLCSLAYFASYITRLDYAAVLVELIQDLNTTKQIASIGVTGSFITYGLGMFLAGWLGDKMRPRVLIAIGLLGSSLINVLAGTLHSVYAIAGLWCFNGLFQAMIYPPLMRLMGDRLDADTLASGITWVTVAANIATIVLYAVSPVLITLSGWRSVFIAATVVGVGTTAAFLLGTEDAPQSNTQAAAPQKKAPVGYIIKRAGLVPIFFAIIIMGALRDGIQTWMPTYVSEVLQLDASASILTSVILPIFSVTSVTLAKILYSKVRSAVKSAFITYAIGAIAAIVLVFTFQGAPTFGAVMVALINAAMHGTNLLLISMLPAFFQKYGKISTFSGLMNAFVYVGAAISTYGIAVISENCGWLTTIICWAALAITGTAICLLRIKKWDAFTKE